MARGDESQDQGMQIISDAIYRGINSVRDSSGVDISSEQLFKNYLDQGRIDGFLGEIEKDLRFRRLSDEKKAKFVSKNLEKYIIEKKPFNEAGQRIIQSSLETMVDKSSFLGRLFSTEEGRKKRGEKNLEDYLSQKKVAEEVSYAVSKNPKFYQQEMPVLVEAAKNLRKSQMYNEVADIFYGAKAISKDVYQDVKSKAQKYTGKLLEAAESGLRSYASETSHKAADNKDYSGASKVAAGILGICGALLIISSGLRMTGNVVGNSSAEGAGFMGLLFILVGIGLFVGKK